MNLKQTISFRAKWCGAELAIDSNIDRAESNKAWYGILCRARRNGIILPYDSTKRNLEVIIKSLHDHRVTT